ncbi:MAG: hypothetical protein JSS67_12185 [Bacteroidetes bacterium]|nr:hypothetical protein [Bacteroidota bacterium]
MLPSNRDLLVLTKFFDEGSPFHLQEVEMLNKILKTVEHFSVFCGANEIFDINKYEIVHRPYEIQAVLKNKNLKPFVFIINKN